MGTDAGKILVELQSWMGDDAAIANAAWTSTYDLDRREEKALDQARIDDLVRRCARDGHSVPFESVIFRFWIRMPTHTDRQHMTHRVGSHNGLSGRYRTLPEDWYGVPQDVVAILNKVDQGYGDRVSLGFDVLMQKQQDFYSLVLDTLKTEEKRKTITNPEYKRVREIIRGVIGTANMTERTTIMNLRSFANYQFLRNSCHAQAEIRLVAQKMLALVEEKNICPVAIAALKKKGWLL